MPQKNTLKDYDADAYYHVFARGVNKRKIFIDDKDYEYFTSLFNRYLSGKAIPSLAGGLYPDFSSNLSLISYCLMPNHFHLFIHQNEIEEGLPKFMSSLMTSYSKYFNKKYKRVGSLFESRYKGKRIIEDSHFTHISRYIHMNPRSWLRYEYSSLKYIFSNNCPNWLKPGMLREEFRDFDEYIGFLKEYSANKELLAEIKHELADM